MPSLIPESHADLLSDGKKCVAFLATLMKDKTPQVTPVWFTWDGTYLFINSAKGRVKDTNMRIHPEVAVAILDPNDPSRYLQMRGIVVLISEQGAKQHVEKLAMKYTGKSWTPNAAGEIRVVYKITPGHVTVSG